MHNCDINNDKHTNIYNNNKLYDYDTIKLSLNI